MFTKEDDAKRRFLNKARIERERREIERQRARAFDDQTKAATTIQKCWKQYQKRCTTQQDGWIWWDGQLSNSNTLTILDLYQLIGLYCIWNRRGVSKKLNSNNNTRLKQLVKCMTNTNKLKDKQPYYVLLIDMRYMTQARRYLETLIRCCLQQCISSNDMSRFGSELTFLLQFLNPKMYQVKRPLDPCHTIDIPNILQSISESILKTTLCRFNMRDAQIACVEQITRLEDRKLQQHTEKINSLKLWLATITRLNLYPIEHAGLTSDSLDMETASKFLWRNTLAVPCLSGLISEIITEKLRKWTLGAICSFVLNDCVIFEDCADALSGNGLLFVLGNIVDLWNSPKNSLKGEAEHKLIEWIQKLMAPLRCHFSERQTSQFSIYHPVFKWSDATWGNNIWSKVFDNVMLQLAYLWSRPFIDTLMKDITQFVEPSSNPSIADNLKKLTLQNNKSSRSNHGSLSLISVQIDSIFELYIHLSQLLKPFRRDIISRIAFTQNLLPQLWRFMNHFGPKGNMQIYLDAARKPDIAKEPLIHILRVFCEASSLIIITLDDTDIFQRKHPFSPQDLVQISRFLNLFYFTLIQQEANIPTELPPAAELFKSARQLLLQIFELDRRQQFCPKDHWLLITASAGIRSFFSTLARTAENSNNNVASNSVNSGSTLRMSTATAAMFLKRLKEGDPIPLRVLQLMPHSVPFSTRLRVFREWIELDKSVGVGARRHITVRRNRVLEDGYSALASLSVAGWKGVIRVSFVNELGLGEAGIDQGGPFKDFLTILISEAFQPNYGLFAATQLNNFYPNPTSFVQGRQHIELFKFIGKAIGKALYEGILIDVQFVGFILAKLLGRNVFLDELKELDEELWKNLTFIKHYEGDVKDLGLVFESDEDVFGKVETHELKYNGRNTPVTDSNKIEYVYLMADYKLNQRSKEQVNAFVKGFKSIISESWIKLFSPPELQRVLSGENTDVDLTDLRKHTRYENGYFDNHPVINSFWQILSEFSTAEKKSFLKFTTGCPNPPLGGFEYLQPPFTVRMVSADAVTSESEGRNVVKSLFRLNNNRSGRLPTSSTCFNLFKLPAYTKKSLLKEKICYAINMNTGFELN